MVNLPTILTLKQLKNKRWRSSFREDTEKYGNSAYEAVLNSLDILATGKYPASISKSSDEIPKMQRESIEHVLNLYRFFCEGSEKAMELTKDDKEMLVCFYKAYLEGGS